MLCVRLLLRVDEFHLEPVMVGVSRHAGLREEELNVRAEVGAVKGAVENVNLCVEPGFVDVALAAGVLDDMEVHRNLKVPDRNIVVDDRTDALIVSYRGINSPREIDEEVFI